MTKESLLIKIKQQADLIKKLETFKSKLEARFKEKVKEAKSLAKEKETLV